MTSIPSDVRDRRICIVGLGYVGLTLATVMAEVGFEVTGVEIRPDVVEMLRKGVPHFFEPSLADRLSRVVAEGRLTVSESLDGEYQGDVFIITVGTPLDENGRIRLDMIEHATGEVANVLTGGELVILRSTVRFGTTAQIVQPILKASEKSFDLAFCPERTLQGQALTELRTLPQIVGGNSHSATVRSAQLFQLVTPTVVRVSDMETAEMIKLVDNAHRDVQFAYSNEVARLCDAVGISAAEVITTGKLGYQRTNLPMPGLVGGPCLEKDPHILAQGMEPFGVDAELTVAARRLNERQPREVVAQIGELTANITGFPNDPRIALLGIAFKGRPETDDLRGTMARPVFDALREQFPAATFVGYDAVVPENEIRSFGVEPKASLEEAFEGAHLVVIVNNHPIFAAMAVEDLAQELATPALIYDFWNTFAATELRLPHTVGYIALGSRGRAILPSS